MEVVHERCAGLDVHQHTVVACVRIAAGGKVAQEVRTFDTTTQGLLALCDWLGEHGCTHVAMEATGVYWKPVWHVLESDFELVLANAAHIRNVPGRKTDVNDAMWIADLLAHGLIRASFVPPAPVQELRDLTRTRKQLVREIAQHTQRIQKILEDANIKLTGVISDMLGTSGRAMLDALVARRDRSRTAGRADQRPAEGQPGRARRGAARTRPRASSVPAQAASGADRRPPGGRARRGGARGREPRALSRARPAPDDDAGRQRDRGARHRRRDRHRHVALPHGGAPDLVGRPLSAQRRERRQAPLDPGAQGRPVAQDDARPGRVGRRRGRRTPICAPSSSASRAAAAPRRPSSPSPPRCSPPPTTSCAMACPIEN